MMSVPERFKKKKKKVSFIVNGPIPNQFYFKAYSK